MKPNADRGLASAPVVAALAILLGFCGAAWGQSAAEPKPGEDGLETWVRRLNSPKVRERRMAAQYFASESQNFYPQHCSRIIEDLMRGINDEDAFVRQKVVQAMGGTAQVEGFWFSWGAQGALNRALEDKDTGVRQAAAKALGAFGIRSATSRTNLLKLASRGDPLEREAAIVSLRAIIDPGPPPTAAIAWASVLLGLALLGAILALPVKGARPLGGALAVVGGLGLLLKLGLFLLPGLQASMSGWGPAAFVEPELGLAAGALLCAGLAMAVDAEERKVLRRLSLVLAFGLVAGGAARSSWLLSQPEAYKASKAIWDKKVCLQSTPYTGEAAAMATVLRARGRLDATEHEAAQTSLTAPGRGASELGVARGLKLMEPEARVRLRALSLEELEALKRPCLVMMRDSFWGDRAFALLKIENGRFHIGDPKTGPTLMDRQAFAEAWRGRAITLD